jgi:FixJ family two-component response regulator
MENAGKNILLVDDDVSILTACSEALLMDGYKVDAASSGEKALELLKPGKYDVVITDLAMGEVGGMEVLRQTKNVSPETQVMVLTSHGTIENAVEAMKLGAFDFLPKPFDPYRLDVSMHRVFQHIGLLNELSVLRRLVRLYEATKALTSMRNDEELSQSIVKYACEVAEADGTSLLTMTAGGTQWVVTAAFGERSEALAGNKMDADPKKVEQLNAESLSTLTSLEARRYFQREKAAGFDKITSSLSFPIFFNEHLLAILNISRTNPDRPVFKEEDLKLVTIFAGQASFAIENMRLFKFMQSMFVNKKEVQDSLQQFRHLKTD